MDKAGEPISMQTMFGWVILGSVSANSQQPPSLSHHLISNSQLHDSLTKFWELEEVLDGPDNTLTVTEIECESHFQATHSRDSIGRYIARLPFFSSTQQLRASRHIALRCLKHLFRQLSLQPNILQQYQNFISEYKTLGHMKWVPSDAPEPTTTYYLPHYCVVKEDISKFRVVFNGSSKTSSGTPLNDLLHTWPCLLAKIADVLMYLWSHRFIFLTEIVKMFRLILIPTDDWDLRRILWMDNNEVITF